MTIPNHALLIRRFLLLPFRHQIAVAKSLTGFEAEIDDELPEHLFRHAKENGLFKELWYEIEKRHTNPGPSPELYPLADWPTDKEAQWLGFACSHHTRGPTRRLMGRKTGEFRPPKRGEWFLSGAIPEGYRAFADMDGSYYLLKLVAVKVTVTHEQEEDQWTS